MRDIYAEKHIASKTTRTLVLRIHGFSTAAKQKNQRTKERDRWCLLSGKQTEEAHWVKQKVVVMVVMKKPELE